MAKKAQEEGHHWCCCYGRGNGLFWGLIILLIGLWILAKDLGWITFDVSIWAIVLIFVGLWILLKPRKRVC